MSELDRWLFLLAITSALAMWTWAAYQLVNLIFNWWERRNETMIDDTSEIQRFNERVERRLDDLRRGK